MLQECHTILQTRFGAEISSPTCWLDFVIRMRYICTGGGRCVVGWCLDSPCGGSITDSLVWHLSFCSRSQYQCGPIIPADVCVDVVRGLSVGRNQDCVPACCIILRYKLHYLYRGMVLSSGLQGPSRVSGCFLLCNAFPFFVR